MHTLNESILRLQNSKKGIRFIRYHGAESRITYKELYEKAKTIMSNLQQQGLKVHEKVLLQIEDQEEMLCALWGSVLGGFCPIVVSLAQTDAQIERIEKIALKLDNPKVIVDEGTEEYMAKIMYRTNHKDDCHLLKIKDLQQETSEGTIYEAKEEDIAMILFSSGSTGTPKGICVSHQNLYDGNIEAAEVYHITEEDVALNWMPLVHMVGISFCHLVPLYVGMEQILVDKSIFLIDPDRVLKLASEYQASYMVLPSFGLKTILEKVNMQEEHSYDFSKLKMISCSGESVPYQLTKDFADAFAPYKLDAKVISPLYGSTESQIVSMMGYKEGVSVKKISRKHMAVGEKIVPDNTGDAIAFTELGNVNSRLEVRIRDDNGNTLEDEHVGIIEMKGTPVARYFYTEGKLCETEWTEGQWFDSGDIGFISNKKLTIIGRRKEMVIINAVNYYLSDIEKIANEVDGVIAGNVHACALKAASGKDEGVVLFAETKLSMMEYYTIAEKIGAAIKEKLGLKIDGVVVLGECPRTETGKVDKVKLMEAFQEGAYQDKYCSFDDKEVVDDGSVSLIESKIIQIWIKLLGAKQISANQNFFQIGGDSVNAFTMLDEVMKEFNVNLNIRAIYQRKTVREFAKLVEEELKKQEA